MASPPFESGREQKGPEAPAPQSQSFYRRYGSVLPTSLTYIVLSARGCTPRRPAADMGTRSHDNDTASLGFSWADPGAPDGTRAVPLCGLARTRSPVDPIPGSGVGGALPRKENSPRGPGRRFRVRLRRRGGRPREGARSPCRGSRISTRFPFG